LVKIRLRRVGSKKRPSYRLVVADARAPRDGVFIDIIGHYNPLTDPETVVIAEDKARYWLENGAQPTDTAARLLAKVGIIAESEARKEKMKAVTTAKPKASKKKAKAAKEEPKVAKAEPEAVASEEPEAGKEEPKAAKVEPETGAAEKPEAGKEEPKAAKVEPETGAAEKPEAGKEEPEAGATEEPEASKEEPEAAKEEPEASEGKSKTSKEKTEK